MNRTYPYALYLDNKITGAVKQLVEFYTSNIFDKSETILYLKKYRSKQRVFEKVLDKENISYKYMKPNELDALKDQTIFYPFNAQSNCRLVANRKLKHVFITHGESNKVSSIKPIIRIYDHVTMAGPLSLERYYKSGLFDEHDYKKRRLLLTGDTFITPLGFDYENGIPVLLYAPTWEGGVIGENYSSLGANIVSIAIQKCLEVLGLNSILIKPHPNLGYRDKSYIKKLYELVYDLKKEKINVYLYRDVSLTGFIRYKLFKLGVTLVNDLSKFKPRHALVDISAMESKCINERVPYHVFYKSSLLREDLPDFYMNLYEKIGIELNKSLDNLIFNFIDGNCLKDRVFMYDNDLLSMSVRKKSSVENIGNFASKFNLS